MPTPATAPVAPSGTTVSANVNLTRSPRTQQVLAAADVVTLNGVATLMNVRATLGGRRFELTPVDTNVCLRVLQMKLQEKLAELRWNAIVSMAHLATSSAHYDAIQNVRDRALARRKGYEELGKAIVAYNNDLANRVIRAPEVFHGLGDEQRNVQAEAFAQDSFDLLKRMMTAMGGLRGSFYESMCTEASGLLAQAYPSGVPRVARPNPAPSRRSYE